MGYFVSCSECEWEETMESVDEILDRQVLYQQKYDEEHTLEFEKEG